MTRNPLFRKCHKCNEITEHWKIYLKTYNKEGYACGECDTLRDMVHIRPVDFKGSSLEVIPIETSLQKSPTDCEGKE